MNHKQEKVNPQDIKSFDIRFNNISGILYRLKQKIGYMVQEYSQIDKKRLATTVTEDEIAPPTEAPIDLESKRQGTIRQVIHINNFPYFQDTVAVPGVNRHTKNKNLFISVAPTAVQSKLASKFSTMLSAVDDPINPEMVIGVEQARTTFLRIATLHPQKPITLLVLGKKSQSNDSITLQNFEVYSNFIQENSFLDADQLIHRFTLGRNDEFGSICEENSTVDAYFVKAHSNHITLSSSSLDTLYAIYEQSLASDNPILIHCTQGLDRAPKIAFAFELLRNFDKCFNHTHMSTITQNLYDAYSDLQRSRSPIALSGVEDLEQAVHLAFALKIVELNHQCMKNLSDLLNKHANDLQFTSRHKKITELRDNLAQLATDEQRLALLKSTLLTEKELTTHYNYPALLPQLRANPEYRVILENLMSILTLRIKVEEKLFKLCNTSDIANECAQRRLESSQDLRVEDQIGVIYN